MNKRRIVVSFSGGETSGYMMDYMMKKYKNDPSVEILNIFANTGEEHEATLEFANMCDRYFNANLIWVECVTNPKNGEGVGARVVDFYTASRNGEPFADMITKHGIPNAASPHCTRELKASTIKAYLRSIGWSKYEIAIGIRIDEPKRLDWEKAKRERLLYPLALEHPTKKPQISHYWSKMHFRLNLKTYEGNCKTCWKKSERKLKTIAIENPSWFDFFKEMEKQYEYFIPESRLHNEKIKLPIRFFRKHTSVSDILEDAQQFPFEKAKDERFEYDFQLDLWDSSLDASDGCTESCEVF